MKTSQDSAEKPTKKYWAFISYRHAGNLQQDRGWASLWLWGYVALTKMTYSP